MKIARNGTSKIVGLSRSIGTFAVCVLLHACSGKHPGESGFSDDATAQFPEDPESHVGQEIEFRGFLDARLGSLVIYQDEFAASQAKLEGRPIVIRDTSPKRQLRHEGGYLERACTGTYVSLVGVVGFLEEHQFYGVSEIKEIRTFDNEQFQGTGTVCYSSADPNIYSPVEKQNE